MAATKRLNKELFDLEKELEKPDSALYKIVRNIVPDETNIFKWTVVILPTQKPYDRWGFSVNLAFTPEYPFKPPKVSFPQPIYHPNVDENGNVCLPVVSPDSWKPATKVLQIVTSLVDLVDKPKLDSPVRADVAQLCTESWKTFAQNAEKNAEATGLPRDRPLRTSGK